MPAFDRLGITPSPATAEAEETLSASQQQTRDAFGYKWARRDSYDSDALKKTTAAWLVERYCNNEPGCVADWLAGDRKLILDAGCGSGFSGLLLFGELLKEHDYLGVDISTSVEVARRRFEEAGVPGEFLQTSLTELPMADAVFDLIFSEGVLHHTDDTGNAIRYLTTKLKPGGLFLFYVYAKKAVVREFTDDHIRQELQGMSDEEAWDALRPLTQLGKALGDLNVEIDVPEDIPYLGIPKGRIDLQRFFYWNLCKAYYRPEYGIEEMNHINFDWFRPLNCHRHTKEEVAAFCESAGLAIERMNIQESGITVVARKR